MGWVVLMIIAWGTLAYISETVSKRASPPSSLPTPPVPDESNALDDRHRAEFSAPTNRFRSPHATGRYSLAHAEEKEDTPVRRTRPSPYERRQELIEAAIARGASIRFTYTNFKGERSTRTVKPQEVGRVEYMGRLGRNNCVTGFCHLRGEVRNFNIMKMEDVQVEE